MQITKVLVVIEKLESEPDNIPKQKVLEWSRAKNGGLTHVWDNDEPLWNKDLKLMSGISELIKEHNRG